MVTTFKGGPPCSPEKYCDFATFSVKSLFFENFESLCENWEANFDFLKKISETKLYVCIVFFRFLLVFLEKKTMHRSQFSICHCRNFSILIRGVIQKSVFGHGKLHSMNVFFTIFFLYTRCIQNLNVFTPKLILTFLQLFKNGYLHVWISDYSGKSRRASFNN